MTRFVGPSHNYLDITVTLFFDWALGLLMAIFLEIVVKVAIMVDGL